jgi:hypothetical protein
MFSFDVSAIDIVLAMAVAVLFVLYVAKKPESARDLSTTVEKVETLQENQKTASRTLKSRKNVRAKSQTDFRNCAHSFGYLRSIPRNTPVPDECLGCPSVVQCVFQSK